MNKKYPRCRSIFVFLILFFACMNVKRNNELKYLLPTNDELQNWQTKDEPVRAIGEDLYELINGGAEVYHEYGFKEVISQEYESAEGNSINLEIYKMENSFSAFGMYSFKTGNEGDKYNIGNEAFFEDYYLNFWKGEYLITLIGFDTEKETIAGILELAKIIEKKISSPGKKPPLIDLISNDADQPFKVKYLKGNLALFNNYEFESRNIFGMAEGAIGFFPNFEIFVFKYETDSLSNYWYKNGMNHLQQNSRYVIRARENKHSILLDDKENIIHIKSVYV